MINNNSNDIHNDNSIFGGNFVRSFLNGIIFDMSLEPKIVLLIRGHPAPFKYMIKYRASQRQIMVKTNF